MIAARKSEERGHVNYGWLDTSHTFSFGDYQDERFGGFRTLRVLNEDRVQPSEGFAPHAHRDMEILSWVLAGELQHRDSLGNGSVVRPGEVQKMSAGTGVTHSEFNPSPRHEVHFLQLWIEPERKNLMPSYDQRTFPPVELRGRLRLVGSRGGREGSVTIHQDVNVYAGRFEAGEETVHRFTPGRHAWLQVARGSMKANSLLLARGDGAAIAEEEELRLIFREASEVLLLDLA